MTKTNEQRLPSELKGLQVHGETLVGWDEHTLPNEILDRDDNLTSRDQKFGVADPRSPGRHVHDDPGVEAMRNRLRQHNGLDGLEICEPAEAQRAARIFQRDGFVVVRDLLNDEQLGRFRTACARVLKQMLSIRGRDNRKYVAETGRLPHRYSYGTSSASRQMLQDPVWAGMIDLPTTTQS